MEFVEDDIYAYAAAELLFPRPTKNRNRAALLHNFWLVAMVLFTLALQIGFFTLVKVGGSPAGLSTWDKRYCQGLINIPIMSVPDLKDKMLQLDGLMRMECILPTSEQLTHLQAEIQAYDPNFQPACMESNKQYSAAACMTIKEGHGNATQHMATLVAERQQQDKARGVQTQAVVALAMVAIAFNVHREFMRAAVLARIVMSHTGWMPPFFAPLFIQAKHEFEPPKNSFIAVCARHTVLLCLPLAQMATCVLAWMAAAQSFAEGASKGEVITVVLNCVAVLFVLELDNHMCTIVREADALRRNNGVEPRGQLKKREVILAHEAANVQDTPYCPNQFWRHWYACIIGLFWFSLPLQITLIVGVVLKFGVLAVTASYVAVLFAPPLLPASKPAGSTCHVVGRLWRFWARGFMFNGAVVVAMLTVHSEFSKVFKGLSAAFPVFAAVLLYAVWPFLACLADEWRAKHDDVSGGTHSGHVPMQVMSIDVLASE